MALTVKKIWENNELKLESGRLATQADGSVLVSLGETMVLCTAVLASKPADLQDFTDLTIYYQERFYAAGKIPGGFIKREGKPSDKEALISRIIDRSLRPAIKLRCDYSLQVTCTVLSYDGENFPDVPALIGATAAIKLAGVDCKTIAGTRVCITDDKFMVLPKFRELETASAEIFISGTTEIVTMIEFEAAEKSKQQTLKAIKTAKATLATPIEAIDELIKQSKVEVVDFIPPHNEELHPLIKRIKKSKIYKELLAAFEIKPKKPRVKELMKCSAKIFEQFGQNIQPKTLHDAISTIKYSILRDKILLKRERADGRGFDEIRNIACEVGVLPRVHGSALFTRGETQVLSVVTLGGRNDMQMSEDIISLKSERFMLHYNFPSFAVGEISVMKNISRREIGHGNLARKAILPLLPQGDKNAIRVVAEVLECNGSSSMASVCASSLALMDAGVQISKHAAGIAMGMVQGDKEIVILSDIVGEEDHLGDMDFKLAGTLDGITAMQMDVKTLGVSYSILEKIIDQAIVGVKYIIARMHTAIITARAEVNNNIQKAVTIKVEKEKIRALIGPGGKTIKEIISSTRSKIDIEDNGTITINASNQSDLDLALEKINSIVSPFRTGELYDVSVTKSLEYGIFVKMFDGSEGFIHVSDLSDSYIDSVEKHVAIGQEFKARMIGFDKSGRVKLTLKAPTDQNLKKTESDNIEAPSKVTKEHFKKRRFF
jgi:polyribonucleotide nucleotidyltransferase